MKEIEVETKLLKKIYMSLLGGAVRQETPRVCPRCGEDLTIESDYVDVVCRDIEVGGKQYTLLDPKCPTCGLTIRVDYYIIQ